MYELEHINTAINVLKSKLIYNTDKYINKNEIVYIYCGSGINSSKICNVLNRRGYKVFNILGGFNAWKKM